MEARPTAEWLIAHFGLEPLPVESCLLTRTYTSSAMAQGSDVRAGHRVQHLVPAGTWQATDLLPTYPDRAADIERLGVR